MSKQDTDELHEQIFQILVTQGQDYFGVATGLHGVDGQPYRTRTIEHLELIKRLIEADRKKHELQARIETAEELLGITATWHSSDWTNLFRRRITELKQELESYE